MPPKNKTTGRLKPVTGIPQSGTDGPVGIVYFPVDGKMYGLSYHAYYHSDHKYYWVPAFSEVTDLQTWQGTILKLCWASTGMPDHDTLDCNWSAGRKLIVYGDKIYFASHELATNPTRYIAKIWSFDGDTVELAHSYTLLSADNYYGAYPADMCVFKNVLYITTTERIVTYNGSAWTGITPGGITPQQNISNWSNDYAGIGVHDDKLYVSVANDDHNTGHGDYKLMVTADGTIWETALNYTGGSFGWDGDNLFQSITSFNDAIYMLTDIDLVNAAKIYKWSGVTDEWPMMVAQAPTEDTWRYFGPLVTVTGVDNYLYSGSFQSVKAISITGDVTDFISVVSDKDLTFEATFVQTPTAFYWVGTSADIYVPVTETPADYYYSEAFQVLGGTKMYFSDIPETTYEPVGGLDPAGNWTPTNIEEAVQNQLTHGAKKEGANTVSRSWPDSSHAHVLLGQFVSPPLAGGQELTGNVTAQIRSATTDPAADMALRVQVELYHEDGTAWVPEGGSDTKIFNVDPETPTNEFTTTLTNQQVVEGPLLQNPVTQEGDRLLVLVGYTSFKDDPTPYPGTVEVGTTSNNDLPEDNVTTEQYNPWIWFSQSLEFLGNVSLYMTEITDIDCVSAVAHGTIDDGGETILERGFVWSTSPDPTTDDNKVIVPQDNN